jgi:hypothetical protein
MNKCLVDFDAFAAGVEVLEGLIDVPVVSEWEASYLTIK